MAVTSSSPAKPAAKPASSAGATASKPAAAPKPSGTATKQASKGAATASPKTGAAQQSGAAGATTGAKGAAAPVNAKTAAAPVNAKIAAAAAAPANAKTAAANRVLGTGAAQGVHVVKSGETLGGIAPKYNTTVDAMFQANRNQLASPNVIQVGQQLKVPGGSAPAQGPAPAAPVGNPAPAGGRLQWPVRGPVTQQFSAAHKGIDIAAPEGTPIKAAAGGRVIASAYGTGISAPNGNYTIIDHGGGMQTYYGHQSVREVQVGQTVAAGQEIGRVGHTGQAHGSHLHFQVGQGGMWGHEVNPLPYLG